ncbi:unnamed protein product [Paramecium pentaurelia]|uniref:Uncharacterized protein n=1 Tax=Paramecium pentaurelia TaxID=43138 RepID=A0A8S1XEJ4_9CILI|nr:unnamed protein product [Paramecium pentaurelia]
MQFQLTAAFKELLQGDNKIPKSNLIRQAKMLAHKPSLEPKINQTHRSVEEPVQNKQRSGVAFPILIQKKQQFMLDCEKTKDILKNFNIKLIRQRVCQNEKIHRKLSQHNIQNTQQLNLTFGQNFRIRTRPLLSRQDNSADLRDSHSASRVMSHSQQRLVNKLFQ